VSAQPVPKPKEASTAIPIDLLCCSDFRQEKRDNTSQEHRHHHHHHQPTTATATATSTVTTGASASASASAAANSSKASKPPLGMANGVCSPLRNATNNGPQAPSWQLPPAVAQDLLRRYADLLRVGRISLNGQEVTWGTQTSTACQLENFCQSLSIALTQAAPELSKKDPGAVRFAPYWLCKAVSINYALIEVVLMVQRRVGVLCTIETREDHGSGLVRYDVEIRDGNMFCVNLNWSKANNIVYCDPMTAKRKIKGTLTNLETWFRIPPEDGFLPAYSFQLRLRKSLSRKFTSSITHSLACRMPDRHPKGAESLRIEEPLRSDHPLESVEELAKQEVCAASSAESPLQRERPHPLGQEAFESEGLGPAQSSGLQPANQRPATYAGYGLDATGSAAPPIGCLRVRVLQAAGLQHTQQTWPDGSVARTDDEGTCLYVVCTVGGWTLQTRQTKADSAIWRESLRFPLRSHDLRDEMVIRLFLYHSCRGLRFWGRTALPISLALGVVSPSGRPLVDGGNGGQQSCIRGGRRGSYGEPIAAQLDGCGGNIMLELDVLPPEAASNPSSDSSHPFPNPLGFTPPEEDLEESREVENEADEDEDECVLEVGTSLGLGLRPRQPANCSSEASTISNAATSLAYSGLRSLNFIRVHSDPKPDNKSQSFWCTRPCTRECS